MYSGSSTQLGQEAVQQVDAALVVRLVGGHVVGADPVVDAVTGPTHRSYHVVAGFKIPYVGPDLQHAPERLVTGDQDIVALGCHAVLGIVDLLVCPVHAYAQHLDEDPPAIGDIVDARLRQVGQVYAVGLAGKNGHRFHRELLFTVNLLLFLTALLPMFGVLNRTRSRARFCQSLYE
jgi:hypothetical protein